jgi:hypothetical protein
VTLDRQALSHQAFSTAADSPASEPPPKTLSGTGITSPTAGKQLRNSDSDPEICVADFQTSDSEFLHPLRSSILPIQRMTPFPCRCGERINGKRTGLMFVFSLFE